jgi:hypothetical protein
MMTLQSRIEAFSELGKYLQKTEDPELQNVIQRAVSENAWFTLESIRQALNALRDRFLREDILYQWTLHYKVKENIRQHRIGLILAGNIPMVGWHDVMTNFVFNQVSLIKYSDKDKVLIPFLLQKLGEIAPESAGYFEEVQKLSGYDAVIATGSNNSATLFEYYFSKVPHIIRKNRNAAAVLTGGETPAELELLADDIFSYFGLGCRNVSKIYVPEGYDFGVLFKAFEKYRDIIHHHKYKNNYDYNLALFLLNKEPHIQHDIILLKESEQIASRIASLHYSGYRTPDEVEKELTDKRDQIQCIVSNTDIGSLDTVSFGQSQCPGISDYADGIDTAEFILNLN